MRQVYPVCPDFAATSCHTKFHIAPLVQRPAGRLHSCEFGKFINVIKPESFPISAVGWAGLQLSSCLHISIIVGSGRPGWAGLGWAGSCRPLSKYTGASDTATAWPCLKSLACDWLLAPAAALPLAGPGTELAAGSLARPHEVTARGCSE